MILARAKAFAAENGKKLLVVRFDLGRVTRALVESKPRYDQAVVDYLREHRFRTFDMNVVHVEDYKSFKVPFDAYLKRYLSAHYTPAGNHFFVHSIRDTVVDWLDPKPITYREGEGRWGVFEGYLNR